MFVMLAGYGLIPAGCKWRQFRNMIGNMNYNIEVIKSVWRKLAKRKQGKLIFSVPGQCSVVRPEQAFAYLRLH